MEYHAGVEPLVFLGSIHRRVHRMKRHVDEPGHPPAFRIDPAIPNPADGLSCHQFGGVAFLLKKRSVAMPGVEELSRPIEVGPGIGGAGERAVGVVEAEGVGAPFRLRPQMPFATLRGLVAERLEGRRDGERAGGHRPEVVWLEGLRAEPARIAAAHEGRSRGRADRLHVVPVEFHALGHEPVHDGGFAEALMPADVGPAEIVGDDEQNVGPGGSGSGG